MALTKIPRGLLDTGIADSSDATAITIDSNENVGIGTASPNDKLHIKIGTNLNWQFGYPNSSVTTLAALNDAESAYVEGRIDTSNLVLNSQSGGNVGIGTTSPAKPLHISSADNQPLRVESTDAYSGIELKDNGSATLPPLMSALSNDFIFYGGHASTRLELLRLTAAARAVGIATTPNSGWSGASTSGRVPIQVGFGSISGRLNDLYTEFSNNCYASGTGNDPQWAGMTRYAKQQIELDATGNIIFKTAATVDQSTFDSSPNFSFSDRMAITNAGKVGIGTSSPSTANLVIVETTSGNITSGNDRQGASITLHHEAQWENGYTGGDFAGALNFSSGDSSTGEGVRAAIKTSVDTYYNTNRMRFYVAGSSSTTLSERMQIKNNGYVGIGSTDPQYDLDVNVTGEVQARFKSTGDTGYTQGAIVIESSDSTSSPGDRGQGVYMFNHGNDKTWYMGSTYNDSTSFHIGVVDGASLQKSAATPGTNSALRINTSRIVTKPYLPRFVAYLAANTAYNSGVNQLNSNGWTVVHTNNGSHFSTSTGKFTAPVAGFYQFTINLCTTSGAPATTYWSAEMYTQASGGSAVRVLGGWNEHTAGYQRTEATYTRYLTAGTTVWPGMENATNITLLGHSSGVYTRFDGYLIG